MTIVYNKSKGITEKAKKVKCPRCRGFGAIVGDEDNCIICNGHGSIWMAISSSGWTRPLYARLDDSQLY